MPTPPFKQVRYLKVKRQTQQLSQDLPEVMQAFYGLSHSSSVAGVLDPKTKELIALAIGVATHCDGCIAFHTQAALRAGATRQDIVETLGVTIAMGGGPSLMYATHVMEALEEFSPTAS
ncbi:MAG: carboxymuconolactone decarboxylase family protein [Cyanobacteria bacterium]|nr:carboxymuconolactone decarboxylase family protein [Cyanobacteriota bacterium]